MIVKQRYYFVIAIDAFFCPGCIKETPVASCLRAYNWLLHPGGEWACFTRLAVVFMLGTVYCALWMAQFESL